MKRILIALNFSCLLMVLSAQDSTINLETRPVLSVFLAGTCSEMDYLAENLDVVEFVTGPSSADVHLVMNQMSAGNGVQVTSLVFAGKNRFRAIRDTVVFTMNSDIAREEKRYKLLEKIQLGLVPFIMKTPASDRLFLLVGEVYHEGGTKESKDPWRDWTFELSGSGTMLNQRDFRHYALNLGLNVSRITDRFKLESYSYLDYNESRTSYSYTNPETNTDTTIRYNTCQRGLHSSNLAVRSIGDHFGGGVMALVKSHPPSNIKLRVQAGPAVEFNVFPYNESLQRQFRFMYSLLHEHTQYLEPTIFDRMRDDSWKQNFAVMARFSNAWGYIDASVSGSSYVKDAEKYSLGANLFGNIYIYKGLSVNFLWGMGMYRDRINQPKGYASFDDILTRQKEMATDYQYNFSVGMTYRFGSHRYPTVNPRFNY